MRDLLLGYLLNALEPDEKRELERCLSSDPELRRDLELLRRSLEPLNEEKIGLSAKKKT